MKYSTSSARFLVYFYSIRLSIQPFLPALISLADRLHHSAEREDISRQLHVCARSPLQSHGRTGTHALRKLSSLTNERDASDRLRALSTLIISSCDGVPSPSRAPITQLHSLVFIHEVEVSLPLCSAWRPWLSSPTQPARRMRSASREGTSSR